MTRADRAGGSLTSEIAGFAAGLAFDDLPSDLVARTKLHLLDALGCALASRGSDLAGRLLAVTALQSPAGPVPLPTTDATATPGPAAFAIAGLVNALDFDDGFEVAGKGLGHPGASIVAAALAAGGAAPIAGRALITALAAGFEVNARVILSIQPSPERHRQVYGVCQHQAIGAAAAHGHLLGLDADETAAAIGFAGVLTPLPSLRKYNWERRPLVSFKDYVAPAAEAGVRAVQYVRAGLVGPVDVFDGETGFWRMIGSDRCDPAALVDELGAVWRARNSSLKAYPTCRWMHTALESFEIAIRSEGLAPEAIDAVDIRTSAGLARDFMEADPKTEVDAQFSLPHALSAIAHRVPEQLWSAPRTLADPAIRAFAARVRAGVDVEIDRLMSGPERRPAGRVSVFAAGRRIDGPFVDLPRGTVERPLSAEEVEVKFRRNAAITLPPERVDALSAAIDALDRPGATLDPRLWSGARA